MPAPISKAEIMRKAWATYRQLIAWGQGKPGRALFRAALKRSWADARQSAMFAGIIKNFRKPDEAKPVRPSIPRPIVWMGARRLRGCSLAW
jgi:hypothetical protein